MYDEFSTLQGKTLTAVRQVGADEIYFDVEGGERYKLFHSQNCCEHVYVEDVCGDLEDLVGSPILQASEDSSGTPPDDVKQECAPESQTWTFYKLATIKGAVTLRWYGSSNGYYSEKVSFAKLN